MIASPISVTQHPVLEIPSKNHQTPGLPSPKSCQENSSPEAPKQVGRVRKQLGEMHRLKIQRDIIVDNFVDGFVHRINDCF